MNKNLKRLFVTTTIITSLSSTSDAHAMWAVKALVQKASKTWDSVIEFTNAKTPDEKKQASKKVKEDLVERQEWDPTKSLIHNADVIIEELKNNPMETSIVGIVGELKPLIEETKKAEQEKEKRKALKLEKKQALEAQKREEEQRVKAELALKKKAEDDAKREEAAAKARKQEEWKAVKNELNKLRVIVSHQSLNDAQKSRLLELEKEETKWKEEQVKKREEQKQQREAEKKKNEETDNMHNHLATGLSNRKEGVWGNKDNVNAKCRHKIRSH